MKRTLNATLIVLSLGMCSSAFAAGLPNCQQARTSNETKLRALEVIQTELIKIRDEVDGIEADVATLLTDYRSGKVTREYVEQRAATLRKRMSELKQQATEANNLHLCVVAG